MPASTSTTTRSSFNYCFLFKCLAGVALCGFVIAMLATPSYIVIGAAAALAPMASSAIFFPMVTLLALALLVTLAASIYAFSSSKAAVAPGVRVSYPWYSVPFWFGATYANYGWGDYFFNRNPNVHTHGQSSFFGNGRGHGHLGATTHGQTTSAHGGNQHHHSIFSDRGTSNIDHRSSSYTSSHDSSPSFDGGGHHHGH